ncbi:MAG: TIM44-like domain-containing protein, partial [Deltaproteobacteria bacterium]|nr:TIM44-like domain-containing protein [Nannocystaceae bacterium]
RPGGGHSFGGGGGGGSRSSGGSSSSSSFSGSRSSGGSHGGGDLGVMLVSFVLGAVILVIRGIGRSALSATWSTGSIDETEDFELPPEPPRPVVRFDALTRHDSNFSRVLLSDFVHELYVRAHQARGDAEALAALTPYLAPSARAKLALRGRASVQGVTQVVVARSDIMELRTNATHAQIVVEYDANYTEVYDGDRTPPLRIYARERWRLIRRLAAVGRPPDRVHAFNCPQCAAPVLGNEPTTCTHCGASFERGEHEWGCVGIELAMEATVPPALGGYQPERGTELPTRRSQHWREQLEALQAEDPAFTVATFEARVRTIYARLNEAWSSLRWQDVRADCTDRLWLSQTYWIDAYQAQGLRNRMEQADVRAVEVADIVRDTFFWAITVRVFASAIDTTVHVASDRTVGGSSFPRAYTEYWTLIRSVGVRSGASIDESCPNCGAPLVVGMTGHCTHCDVKITGGAYDWVLSKIEQDDVYRG